MQHLLEMPENPYTCWVEMVPASYKQVGKMMVGEGGLPVEGTGISGVFP